MRKTLYSIHDRLAGTYSVPMAIPEKIVLRQLQYIISDMSLLDCQDKECVKLGEFNDETGIMLNEETVTKVADLTELKKKMMEMENNG